MRNERRHRCHTVLLYGSRSKGEETPASDYDVAGIRKGGARLRITKKKDGQYLDLFVYPERELQKVDERFFHLKGARVLIERWNFGSLFLKRLENALRKPHSPLPPDEINARKVWAFKMLERARGEDIEDNYRRSWLQMALLEDYFLLRCKRYWGSKSAFSWLAKNDPQTHRLFENSLKSPSNLDSLARLVKRVTGRKEP